MTRDWFPSLGAPFSADIISPGGVGIDGTKVGNYVLATIPNRHAIVQSVALVSCAINGFVSGPTVSVGIGSNLTLVVSAVSIGTSTELTSGFLTVKNNIPILQPGDQLILRVSVAAVASDYIFAAFPVGIAIW